MPCISIKPLLLWLLENKGVASTSTTIEEYQQRVVVLEAELARSQKICNALMKRVENSMSVMGDAFSMFETNVLLQGRVRERTQELEHLNERLSSERLMMQTILSHAPIGIWMIDTHFRVQFVNRWFAQMMGISEERFLSVDNYLSLFPSEQAMVCQTSDEACFASTGRVQVQEALPCADGQTHIFDIVKVLIHDEQGVVSGLVGLAIDITERLASERMQESLEQERQRHLKSLGLMAGGVAHDFNNLLTPIMGNAEIMLESLEKGSSFRVHLEHIMDASSHAARLCKQMLAYSESSLLSSTVVGLGEVIAQMKSVLSSSVATGVRVHFLLDKSLPPIEVDVSEVEQIVLNMVVNASDAMEGNEGDVWVSTRAMDVDQSFLKDPRTRCRKEIAEGRYIAFTVEDNGSGISAEVQEKMFEPFFTTKFTGRGLGMSAVLGIVHQHHGILHLQTELGKGTQFTVLFPASKGTWKAVEKKVEVNNDSFSAHVLIVDDELTIRTLLSMRLKALGCTSVEAINGLEAVNIYREQGRTIDLVILDMTMPIMSGDECFLKLKQMNPDVKVILSSGYAENELQQQFFSHGRVDGYLSKPYKQEDLKRVLRQCLTEPDHYHI
ncbi:MAG: response regulator [Zetaproteobacteria bacterium]|nr:response regulator [Zetaproteobacteria bacterium]